MNILILSPYVPHPQSGHGGGEYVYGLLKYLSASHRVTLVVFADQHERALLADVQKLPITVHTVDRLKRDRKNLLIDFWLVLSRAWSFIMSVVRWEPYMVSKWRSRRMSRLLRSLTEREPFDIIEVQFTQTGVYRPSLLGGKTILRAHDVVFRPYFRQWRQARSPLSRFTRWIELCRWHRFELKTVRRFDQVLTFTEQDARLLKHLSGVTRVETNPRGIEIPEVVVPYESRTPNTMLFIGSMDLHSNVDSALWLCEEIFPLVIREIPGATLTVIGKNPPSGLLSAAARYPGIEVPGFVKDIEPYLNSASLFVAPIRSGGGIKTKVIHAASYGLPVVTTPRGAEGIEGLDSSSVITAPSSGDLAVAVCELLKNPPKAAEMAARARLSVARLYGWPAAIEQLGVTYNRVFSMPGDR